MSNWITTAESALAGDVAQDDAQTELITAEPPPLFDTAFAKAFTAPFLAALLWSAVVFREAQAGSPLDPIALLFRVLALAFSLRALLVGIEFVRRTLLFRSTRGHALVLTDEGLLYRAPRGDVVLPREQVLDIREQGAANFAERTGRRWADVYVIAHPDSGRLYIPLPPLFGRTPRALTERLMRWRGTVEPLSAAQAPTPDELPSKLWERAASGERIAGVAVIPHGYGWLKRGPYASMLLGIAVLDGFVRLPVSAQQSLNPVPALLLAAALVIVPGAWYLATRANLAPRRGLALVLTPHELLLRTRAGIQRVPWSGVTRCEVRRRASWSILQGAYETRTLSVQRKDEPNVETSEAYLGVPSEVACGLCDAYRRGLVSVPQP